MSVLINIERPTSCSVCPMLEGDRMDGLCHAASKWLDDDEHWTWYVYPEGDMDDSKPCNCPLVPVPPHGDLIDRDAFVKELEYNIELEQRALDGMECVGKDRELLLLDRICRQNSIRYLSEAPIIIPASKKG